MADDDSDAHSLDEVDEIKRATRLASARQFAVLQAGNSNSRGRTGTSPSAPSSSSSLSSSARHGLGHGHGHGHGQRHSGGVGEEHGVSSPSPLARQGSVQFEEAKRLRAVVEDRESQLKECRYELTQLKSRLSTLQTSEKAWESKHSGETLSLRQSVETAERALGEKKQLVQAECDRLVRLVSGIERHTLHGHHAVASRTTIGLLLKTRHGLENLRRLMVDNNPYSPQLQQSTSDEDKHVLASAAAGSNSASANATTAFAVAGASKTDSLDSALLDMCKHLEEENTRLESALAVAHAELEESQRESSASKLIPHYRLAIVRARAQASSLAEQLQREQEDNRILRDQLESALSEASDSSAAKRSAIFDFVAFKAAGNAAPPLSTASLFSNPAATEAQAKVVQRDLAALDTEIAELQGQLEKTALAKTKGILAAAVGVGVASASHAQM